MLRQLINSFFFYFSKKSGQIKSEYQREYLHSNLDVDFDFAGPTINGSAVAGFVLYIIFLYLALDLKLIIYCNNKLYIIEYLTKNLLFLSELIIKFGLNNCLKSWRLVWTRLIFFL